MLRIADNFELDVSDKRSKDSIKAIIKANLTESRVLTPDKLQAGPVSEAAVYDAGLTFEQKRELLRSGWLSVSCQGDCNRAVSSTSN